MFERLGDCHYADYFVYDDLAVKARLSFVAKLYYAVFAGVKRMVVSYTHTLSCEHPGAALAYNNIARVGNFTGIKLYTEVFGL